MKNCFKKAFVLLLSVAMVFTMMAMPVYAETGEERQDTSFSDQYEVKTYPKEEIEEFLNETNEKGIQRQYAVVNRAELVALADEALPEIEISVNNGILSWEPVEGTEGYNLEINYDENSAFSFFLDDEDNGSFDINEEIDRLIMEGDLKKAEDGNYSLTFYANGVEELLAKTRWTYHYESDREYVPPVEITVEVTDGNMSWTDLEAADVYFLYVNDVYFGWLSSEKNGSYNIEGSIDASIKRGRIEKPDDGVYLLEVRAASGEVYNYGAGTLTYNYESDAVYEGEIEINAWIEDGVLYWDPVKDAERYEVIVAGSGGETYSVTIYEDNGRYEELNGFIDSLIRGRQIEKPEDGNYNIEFVAEDEYENWIGSADFTYNYESEAERIELTDITLTVNDGILSWTEVEGTDYYVLYAGGWGNEISNEENGRYNIDALIDRQIENGKTQKAANGIYRLEMEAYNSQGDYIGSGESDYYYESAAEYKPPAEMDLTVKGGLLSWADVEYSDHYSLLINGEYDCYLLGNENGTYNINDAIDEGIKRGYLEKSADSTYELKIRAIDEYDNVIGEGVQDYTYETEAAYIEPKDMTARIEGGKLYWDAVEGATLYNCELEGIHFGSYSPADLKGMADSLYTRGMIDDKGKYSVSIRAYDEGGYDIGYWSGTFEYTPEKIEIKQIKEIEISDINTNIREGKRIEFTTKVGTKDVEIVEQYWSGGEGKEMGDHSDRLPAKGDVLNYCLILGTDWENSFADTESIVVKYNGKVVKPVINKFSDRFIGLYNMVPPVVIGSDDSQRISRIAGSDRYQTAFMAADRLKKELRVDKFENVVIASGTNFPDALAGAYLAKVKNAPILLVRKQNAAAVADYVKKNMEAKGTVYILGGTGAVPSDMETALKAQGLTKTKRLQGANRYLTNIEILKEAGVKGEDLLVCAGGGYADSLSASATGRPVLLVGGKLLPEQKEYLESIKSKISGNVYAIGGTGAVSEPVFKEVCAYATGEKARVAGDTRYTTSKAVADKFFPAVHNTVVLAYAQNYPDGLAGGPVAYAMNSPLLLVTSSKKEAAATYAKAHGSVKCLVLGGPTLISDAAALAIVK